MRGRIPTWRCRFWSPPPGVRAGRSATVADLEQTIIDAAQGPKKASNETGSVEAHSIKDLIDADRHLGAKAAGRTPRRGIRVTRLVPPGAG